MGAEIEYYALVRLLNLNNQVHDLENRLLAAPLPGGLLPQGLAGPDPGASPIAGMQEEIAQGVRASLAACWLGMSNGDEP